jgi:hypothetical protein
MLLALDHEATDPLSAYPEVSTTIQKVVVAHEAELSERLPSMSDVNVQLAPPLLVLMSSPDPSTATHTLLLAHATEVSGTVSMPVAADHEVPL